MDGRYDAQNNREDYKSELGIEDEFFSYGHQVSTQAGIYALAGSSYLE